MTKSALVWTLCLISTVASTAQFKAVHSIVPSGKVISAAVDRPGELYLVYDDGSAERIDQHGKVQVRARLPFIPDHFDPRDGSRIFTWKRSSNEWLILPPSLTTSNPPVKTDPSYAINPVLLCPSGDLGMIVLDSADWTLRNIDNRTGAVVFESPLQHTGKETDWSYMREYQNLIFLLSPRRGIDIYNKMGKKIRSFGGPGITWFAFLGEELYYLSGDALVMLDLFDGSTRRVQLPGKPRYAFLTDERLYMVSPDAVRILTPDK